MKRIDVDIAVITRGGRVLICQRKPDTTFPNAWEFPGGKREPGETGAECVARELREELNLPSVAPLDTLPPIDHDYPTFRVRLHPHLCALADGIDPEPIGCQQTKWVAPAALRDHAFPPANEPLIEQAIARLTAGRA
jgi:8-oxo-dGTP diphosphatase